MVDGLVVGFGVELSSYLAVVCYDTAVTGKRDTVFQDDDKKELKVTDRRMFTSDGELRGAEESAEVSPERVSAPESGHEDADTSAPAEADASEPEAVREPRSESDSESPSGDAGDGMPLSFSGVLPDPGFADLVSILAEPIALFLGDAPLPDGKSAENLDLARFHIDLLEILKRKTESNLSQEESAVLDDLLYRLRMRYVQKTG
jgi:hypothetical protein